MVFHAPETSCGKNGCFGGRAVIFCKKIQRDGINAMSCVLRRESLSFENMTEMRAAFGAEDFRSAPIRINNALDRARYFVIKAGPAASCSK